MKNYYDPTRCVLFRAQWEPKFATSDGPCAQFHVLRPHAQSGFESHGEAIGFRLKFTYRLLL